ncbi:MAG: hypothetical protein IJF07_04970 [Lachnospiraceae bacterium]|nr:hypothetical protein [Lachnospiraceae bacterium]
MVKGNMGRRFCLLLLVIMCGFSACAGKEQTEALQSALEAGTANGGEDNTVADADAASKDAADAGADTATEGGESINAVENAGTASRDAANAGAGTANAGGDDANAGAAKDNTSGETDTSNEASMNADTDTDGTQATAAPQKEEPYSFLYEFASDYSYQMLSKEEQIWYRDIEVALGEMRSEYKLSGECLKMGMSGKAIDKIFQCVLNDHPEIFYVSGYTYTEYCRGDEVIAISFQGSYDMKRKEAMERREEIEKEAGRILDGISAKASEYDKVKYVYDTIIKSTDYSIEASDHQNIYSVFVGKESVCQGYAKAAQYLLNHLGIESTLVHGKIIETGESHAWNLVQVDGSYYYIDTTWGDASYKMPSNSANAENSPEINYDYFCITTKQLLCTHMIEHCVMLPECVDMAANYYVRESVLFESYDKEQMQQLFQRELGSGKTDITIKCASAECYQSIKTALVDNQEIFQYITGQNITISYACNEKQLSLTFWMTNP